MSKSSWITGLLVALGTLGVLLTAGVVFAFPVGAAIACPSCYGLERFDGDVFVEASMSTGGRIHVGAVLAEARNRASGFYGSLRGDPRILVCATEDCYRRLRGGRRRGLSILATVLVLSPRGVAPVIASHELSHIELHRRLGAIRFLTGAIPARFDEAVAVIVSEDPRYLAPVGAPDRCLVRSDEPLPTGMLEWARRAGEDAQLYAKAACRVDRWMSGRGGACAVVRLLSEVSAGAPFAKAYAGGP